MTATHSAVRYIEPGWMTRNLMNRAVRRLLRMGISVWGARELRVRGRSSGVVRTTVVNLLEHEGHQYLVAPRGTTQWVRNLRSAGTGELRVGRRSETFEAIELHEFDKIPVLRNYLRRWKFEVGQFFSGVDADATDDALARIAPDHPVFRIEWSLGKER